MVKVRSAREFESKKGRLVRVEPMSRQRAKIEALAKLEKGLSDQAWQVLDLLYVGGVMTVNQLGIPKRTLQHYAQQRLLTRYPQDAAKVASRLVELGVPEVDIGEGFLYVLGAVGREIAEMRHGHAPADNYLAMPITRALHDVIANEIVLVLARRAAEKGYTTEWVSRHESNLYRDEKRLLEPDGMIRIFKDDDLERENEHVFLIEYHNEGQRRTRGNDKVYKYYNAEYHYESVWLDTWKTDTFPPLLAVFRFDSVAAGYRQGLDELQAPQDYPVIYGKNIKSIFSDDLDTWRRIVSSRKAENHKGRENIMPWND